jgi:hypothetical protein
MNLFHSSLVRGQLSWTLHTHVVLWMLNAGCIGCIRFPEFRTSAASYCCDVKFPPAEAKFWFWGTGCFSLHQGPWKETGLKLCLFSLHPRVVAGKNTSTVIPASRKRRRKVNRISLKWDSASRPKRRLMRTYFLDKPLHVTQNHSKLAYRI